MPAFDAYPWSLGYIVDEDLRDTGFAVVRGRLRTAEHFQLFADVAGDHRIIGMTCHGVFPMIGLGEGNLPDGAGVIEGRNASYVRPAIGWAHCFRDPDRYLPKDVPRILFSNSDNMDPDRVWRTASRSGPLRKLWDFFYTCLPDEANVVRKNWDLAKRCVLRFAEELGLRGLLVGLDGVSDVPQHPRLQVCPQLDWPMFLRCLAESRVAFFPNTWDPSPRVMAEALCLDVPILVNRDILGGWKYVTSDTGRFFDAERDAVAAMAELRSASLGPRQWFCRHFGRANAGPRLAGFIRHLADASGDPCHARTALFFNPNEWKRLPSPRATR